MVRRICPVCENVMSSRFYCRHCRSLVLHSYLKDINYYLNETHPSFEKDCEYHMPSAADSALPTRPASAPIRPANTPARPAGTAATAQKSEQYYQSREIGKDKTGSSHKFPTAVIIFAVVIIWGILVARQAFFNNGVYRYRQENGYDAEYYTRELEDAEVQAAGKNCNGRYHFHTNMEDAEDRVMSILASHGFSEKGREQISYNEEDGDGSTWYGTDVYVYLTRTDGSYETNTEQPYIDFDYDTATGQLHGFYLVNLELSDSIDIGISLCDFMQEQEGFSSDGDASGLTKLDVLAELVRDGFYYKEIGMVTLNIDSSENALYFVAVYPTEKMDG